MASFVNITVPVPAGTVDHGTPGLICIPTRWIDYVVFFGVNYVAHTLTLTNPPGATKREKFIAALYALFIPGSGIIRSLRWVFALAFFSGNSIERAARSGALCMVLHKRNINRGHQYGRRDHWFRTVFRNHNVRLVPINREVHGTIDFPTGDSTYDFFLVEVPPGAPLRLLKYRIATHQSNSSLERFELKNVTLGNDWNMVKVLYSLGQSLYAGFTLYKAIGTQIDIYGFSAFGLTVVPYALMSILNIVATIVTPTYPCMFLVETPDLDYARDLGGHFAGSVASIVTEDYGDRALPDFLAKNGSRSKIYWLVTFLLVGVPIALVGVLSEFKIGSQRNIPHLVWISLWLGFGSLSTFGLKLMDYFMAEYTCQYSVHSAKLKDKFFRKWVLWWTLFTVPLCVPAIGGMVTVGRMLKEYGSCTRVDFSLF